MFVKLAVAFTSSTSGEHGWTAHDPRSSIKHFVFVPALILLLAAGGGDLAKAAVGGGGAVYGL